ncbi:unnamed protein product, partial [Prorocentrum cordatum]
SQPVRPGPCAAKPPARVGPSFRRRRRGEGPHSLTGMAFDDAVKQKVKDAFKSWDSNGDGIISKNEMKAVLLKLLNKHTSTVTEGKPLIKLLLLLVVCVDPVILVCWPSWEDLDSFMKEADRNDNG